MIYTCTVILISLLEQYDISLFGVSYGLYILDNTKYASKSHLTSMLSSRNHSNILISG